ncbi:DUF6230 family protein [Lentzea sp. NPDC055074]
MGRTRWARFVGVLGIGAVGAGVLLTGMSQGALAASFAVSGTDFKVSADKLTGQGFVQFGGVEGGAGKQHVVALSAFRTASLDKFCQSVFVAKMPVVGDVTLRITADGVEGMKAKDLVVSLTDLNGDLELITPEIGIDANKVSKGPENFRGLPGSFGLQADNANITNLKQTAWATTAHTIWFKGMNLTIRQGKNECF